MNRGLLVVGMVVIVAIMAVANVVGIRSMLAVPADLSQIPAMRLVMLAAGADPAQLAPAYRIQPSQLAGHLAGNSGGPDRITLPAADYQILGNVDTLTTSASRGTISGWAVPSDEEKQLAFVGVWHGGQLLAISEPSILREDVNAALGRETGHSGFSISFTPPQDELCSLGVFTLDEALQVGWLRRPDTACPAN
ncbi:hypothetical protein [Aureimonas mangrovi]|uniref:hypothetical protein n=1 Tax=Aureimonas mangrovi TaxID=2758041 RepID=UPI00163D7B40|nr:hypothetical protein [Aureimonas mangrovi]